jgi:hypothetical protein
MPADRADRCRTANRRPRRVDPRAQVDDLLGVMPAGLNGTTPSLPRRIGFARRPQHRRPDRDPGAARERKEAHSVGAKPRGVRHRFTAPQPRDDLDAVVEQLGAQVSSVAGSAKPSNSCQKSIQPDAEDEPSCARWSSVTASRDLPRSRSGAA